MSLKRARCLAVASDKRQDHSQRHTQHATVHQVRDDGVGCNLHILNPGLNVLHNAHAMPPLWYRGEFRSIAELCLVP